MLPWSITCRRGLPPPDPTALPDAALVLAARDGDREAFTRLAQRHGARLHAYLMAFTSPDRVDDLMQETLLAAWHGLPQLRDVGFGAGQPASRPQAPAREPGKGGISMNEARFERILEQAAAPLRLQGELVVPELPERRAQRSPRWGLRAWSGAAAAAAVLVLGLLWMVERTIPDATPYTWRSVEGLAGITKSHQVGLPIAFGEEIVVQEQGQVAFDLADIGTVTLGPHSRLTIQPPLDPMGDGRYRLSFEEGTLDVFVVAPARAFLVETPWFDVWDLGCDYTIRLDAAGSGSLAVTMGRVRCEGEGFAIEVAAGETLQFAAGQPSSSEPRKSDG